ncbi:MAG: metallophosphoesterase family protein, partial [Planctomycetota bacterium]
MLHLALTLALLCPADGEVVIISAERMARASFPAVDLPAGSLGVVVGGVHPDGKALIWPDLLAAGGWKAVNVGYTDLQAHGEWAVPLVSANVEGISKSHIVAESGGRKVAFVGVTLPPPGVKVKTIGDAAEGAKKAVSEVRPNAQVVVLMAYMTREQAVDLLGKVDGVDLCIVSSRGSGDPEPLKVGNTWIVQSPPGGFRWGRTKLTIDGSGKVGGVSHGFVAVGGDVSQKVVAAKKEHGLPVDPLD